jgi:hypothetical protein
MKLFISWSGEVSCAIAKAFHKWLPMINQNVRPYMSSESIEKGMRWSADIGKELEETRFGILILTHENTDSRWLHFEAGAIARSVEETRLAPILFGIKPSDIEQPLSQFQVTLFEKDEIKKLVTTVNLAAGDDAIDQSLLDQMFEALWPQLLANINPIISAAPKPPRPETKPQEIVQRILEEVLVLSRQQLRILSNPDELFGREVLALLVRLVRDAEGVAVRLTARERDLVLALTARWKSFENRIASYLAHREETLERGQVASELKRFSGYIAEIQAILGGEFKAQASMQRTIDALTELRGADGAA